MTKRRADIGRGLTNQQKKAAELIVANEWGELTENGKKKTTEELAKEIGVARSTLFQWRKDLEFIAYLNMISDDQLEGMRAEVNAALMKLIRTPTPSVKGIELFMKRWALLTDRTILDSTVETAIPRKSDAEIAADIHKLAEMVNGEE